VTTSSPSPLATPLTYVALSDGARFSLPAGQWHGTRFPNDGWQWHDHFSLGIEWPGPSLLTPA
jgi:hypothetical protein